MPQLRVNGVDLSYIEQGTGTSVVFVHGVWMDLRYWEPQRQAIATQYRFMAYNLRYHGTAPWPDAGQYYSLATHAADLAAFMDRRAHLNSCHAGHEFKSRTFPRHWRKLWTSLSPMPESSP